MAVLRCFRGALGLAALSGALFAQSAFEIKDGDRVVLCGDSYRDQRLYGTLLETWLATRHPEWKVKLWHSGWEGTEGAADQRLESEIVAMKPTMVVVLATGPDGRPAPGYGHILDKVRSALPQTRLTLLLPPPGDVSTQPNQKPPILANLSTPPAGRVTDAMLAEALLRAWGAPPSVMNVEIDLLTGSVTRADDTTVRDLQADRIIFWSQDDRALPAPLDDGNTSGLSRALNRQSLKIRGLTEPHYKLTIDGEQMGTFWREQLEAGIDVTTLRTPMLRQAAAVHALTVERSGVDYARWLDASLSGKDSNKVDRASWEALAELESDITARRRALAQPRTHDYELQPAM